MRVSESLNEEAERLDAADPLAHVRKRFVLPAGQIYMESTCLGPLTSSVSAAVREAVDVQWGRRLIDGWWEDGWWEAPARAGDKIGRLLGAAPGQVVVSDSTTVQLFNALVAASRLRPGRKVILSVTTQFPTARYITDSAARMLDLTVRRVPPAEIERYLRADGEAIGVLLHEPVDFRTGELYDLAGLTRAAHAAGCVTVWDLCHAAGIVPVDLDANDVDMAVGCTYKYLCGGPGSPAFIYVGGRHQNVFDQPLPGWNGHEYPFGMRDTYQGAPSIARARIGTPPIISMIALEAALDAYDAVDMRQVRQRSLSLTGFFMTCAEELLTGTAASVATPREPQRRAGHVAVCHGDAPKIVQELRDNGVAADHRPPDLMRFGLHPLYTTHREVYAAVCTLRDLVV
ncbi:kynureninase [Actinomadura graeca]|uniref:kynureninase n=1 Tax=Actinomadura graeca TaxID=2750812 RepID=UPI001E47A4AA|nr:aminotransferase class V-fold PLP-dependent enzyme [Actinomadura graeca]